MLLFLLFFLRSTYSQVVVSTPNEVVAYYVQPTFCPEDPMTPLCHNETQQECPKDRDIAGCFHGYYCFPRYVYPNIRKCPLECPPWCSDNEQFCHGKVVDGCPEPDKCIPKYDSRYCPLYCSVGCEEGQKICKGIRGENGCKGPDTCQAPDVECPREVYDDRACHLAEQPECGIGETLCEGGYDMVGCKKSSFCAALKNKTDYVGVNGVDGCPTFCPPPCIAGIESECPPTYDEDGCQEEVVCRSFVAQCPKSKFEPGTGCPVPDNKDCLDDPKKQICHRESAHKSYLMQFFASEFGYSNKSSSHHKENPICDMGHFCADKYDLDASCPIHCPVHCDNATQKSCPGVLDENGCLGMGTCVSKVDDCPEGQYGEKGCFIHEDVTCGSGDMRCPGIKDQRGCTGRASCLPENGGCDCPNEEFDDKGCLTRVPNPQCKPDEMLCPKGKSAKGCDMGFHCIPAYVNGCPNHCPPHCNHQQQACPVVASDKPTGNCTLQNYECVDIVDSKTGCEVLCDSHCQVLGLQACPTVYNEDGCPVGPPVCTSNPKECAPSPYTEYGCTIIKQVDNCTAEGGRLQLCKGGNDAKGCPRLNSCIPSFTPFDNRPVYCPVVCSDAQLSCSKGTFEEATLGEFCVSNDAHLDFMEDAMCTTHCPAACDWSFQKACSGGYNKMTGCPLQDVCVPKHRSCSTFGG